MNPFKKSSSDDLDAQLRGHRAEPGDRFTRSLARTVTPETRWVGRRPRYALVGGMAAIGLATFALAGGVGAASHAVGGTTSLISTAVGGNNDRSHQPTTDKSPANDQYGHRCDHWYDHWSDVCKGHHGGNGGNGGGGNGGGSGHGGNGGGGNGGGSGQGGNGGGKGSSGHTSSGH
jgi:hypothetical protein